MERLEEFIAIKRKNAIVYKELLSNTEGVKFLWEKAWAKSNFWFYTVEVQRDHKKPLMDSLLAKNIQIRPIWKLIHTLPMYKDCFTYQIQNAVDSYERCINLPCSVSLKEEEIIFVGESIKKYFNS